MKKGNVKALLPIGVFLVLYLGLGFLFEYGLKIPMGFTASPLWWSFSSPSLWLAARTEPFPWRKS